MSDYSHQNAGLGGRGIVVGLLLIFLFIAGLAFLGASGPNTEPGTAAIDPGAPAATSEVAPAGTNEVAPAATE